MTQAQIKFCKSLHTKEGRRNTGLFLVEGAKNVLELLASDLTVVAVYCTEGFMRLHRIEASLPATEEQLSRAGTLQTNTTAIAIAKIPAHLPVLPPKGITLALDGLADPGNVGTIWRIADWFGIGQIWASPATADAFSPKTIAASMGAFARIPFVQTPLYEVLMAASVPVLMADMSGQNAFSMTYPDDFVLVIGSESHGISPEVRSVSQKSLTIPRFGRAESLNAAVACGIIVSQALSKNSVRTSL